MKPSVVFIASLVSLALATAPFVGPANAKTASSQGVSILPGGNSKAPIHIEADQLDYFEKESKAIYAGNVVAMRPGA